MKRLDALNAIACEHDLAIDKFPTFRSAHEGLAIIEEEFEELKREVFRKQSERSIAKMKQEAIQLGAMAMRFLIDLP